jgi:copper transport protein
LRLASASTVYLVSKRLGATGLACSPPCGQGNRIWHGGAAGNLPLKGGGRLLSEAKQSGGGHHLRAFGALTPTRIALRSDLPLPGRGIRASPSRGIFAFLLVLLAAAVHAGKAEAHATLIRSDPADRVVVAQSPVTIELTFNEPVSPLAVRLIGPSGEAAPLNNIVAKGNGIAATPSSMLPHGTYLMSWRVISLDGHPVGGALTFSIGAPSATSVMPPQTEADGPLRWAIWAAKLALYVGLFCGIGGAFYAAWIAAEPLAVRAHRLIAAALLSGMAAAVISVGLQGLDVLGLSLWQLGEPRVWLIGLATSYGWTAGAALVALLAGILALATRSKPLSSLALLSLGLGLAASGHAAAAEPQLLTRPAVLLHGITVAFWIGALLPLAAAMHSAESRTTELLRFSRAIPVGIFLLVLSGVTLAIVQLGQFNALWTTDYGSILFRKLVLVAMLIGLAAINRYVLTPRIVGGSSIAARRLTLSIVSELLIVAVVLGLVATWRFTPPARALLAAAQAPLRIHIHGDKAMADLTVEPADGADHRILVSVLDGQFAPLPAKELALVFAKPEAGIEPLRISATLIEGVNWRIDHVQLPALGDYHLRVEILVSDFEKIVLEDEVRLRR